MKMHPSNGLSGLFVLLTVLSLTACSSGGGATPPANTGGNGDGTGTPVATTPTLTISLSAVSAVANGTAAIQATALLQLTDGTVAPDGTQVTWTTTVGTIQEFSGTNGVATIESGSAVINITSTTVAAGFIQASALGQDASEPLNFAADTTTGGTTPPENSTSFTGALILGATPTIIDAGAANSSNLSGFAKNADNTPYVGPSSVTWSVVGPGAIPQADWGIIDIGSSIANGQFGGIYRAAEQAGLYTILAWLDGVTDYVVIQVIDRQPTSLSILASESGLDADGTSQSLLTVTVLDQLGEPVADGTQVQLQNISGLGSLSPQILSTVNGTATAQFTAGNVGGNATVAAQVNGLNDQVTIVLTDVSPQAINVSAVPTQVEQQSQAFVTATVRDGNNNPVAAGTPITFFVTPGTSDASLVQGAASTNEDGKATTILNAGTNVGIHQVYACYNGCALSGNASVSIVQPQIGSVQFDSATPAKLGVKGSDNGGNAALPELSTIRFEVLTSGGAPVPDGTAVSFALQAPPGTTLLTPDAQTIDGIASAKIRSGSVAGLAVVQATVLFNGQPFIANSNGIPIQSGPPHDGHISLTVAIEDYIKEKALGINGLQQSFSVFLGDRFNNPVPDNTEVFFSSEAGLISPSDQSNNGIANAVLTSADIRPIEVTTGELRNVDFVSQQLSNGSVAHSWPQVNYAVNNQRVRVAVLTFGEERFYDNNGNGLFDGSPTETTLDLPEPYLDIDSNGIYSTVVNDYSQSPPVQYAEFFWDSLVENNAYDGANGVYDPSTLLIDSFDVFWTSTDLNIQYLPEQYIDNNGNNSFDPGSDIPVIAVLGSEIANANDVITNCTGVASVTTEQLITDGITGSPTTSFTPLASAELKIWAGDQAGMWPFNGESIQLTDNDGFDVTPSARSINAGTLLAHGLFFTTLLNDQGSGIDPNAILTIELPDNQSYTISPICVIGAN